MWHKQTQPAYHVSFNIPFPGYADNAIISLSVGSVTKKDVISDWEQEYKVTILCEGHVGIYIPHARIPRHHKAQESCRRTNDGTTTKRNSKQHHTPMVMLILIIFVAHETIKTGIQVNGFWRQAKKKLARARAYGTRTDAI